MQVSHIPRVSPFLCLLPFPFVFFSLLFFFLLLKVHRLAGGCNYRARTRLYFRIRDLKSSAIFKRRPLLLTTRLPRLGKRLFLFR